MILSKYRISKSHFPLILRNPSLSGDYFRVVIAPSISKELPNFSVIISKKHVKLAVMRNLFRRTVYQVIHDQITQLPVKSIIFVMQKSIPYEKTALGRKNAAVDLSNDIKNILDQIIKKYDKNK